MSATNTKAKRYNKLSLDTLSHAVEAHEQVDISNIDTIDATEIIVIKRDGRKEPFDPDKMRKVCLWATDELGLEETYLTDELIRDTKIKLHKEIHIRDMFQQVIVTAVNKISLIYPQWENIAGKLQLMSYYKETYNIGKNINYPHLQTVLTKGIEHKIYDRETINSYSPEEIEELNSAIDPERDFLFTYKSLVTFFDKYCLNYSKTRKLELPQLAYMRVAMALMVNEKDRVSNVIAEYNGISQHLFTRATPIMLNALTPGQQLSSCVLNTIADDSHSILDTGKNLGIYSKFKGGTALDVSTMRAKGGYIEGTQGYSSGPTPFMKFYESIMKAWNQGGKRPGALCIYFSWWHLDAFDTLSLKSNGGTDENRARSLQYGIKLNQYFIDAVINDEEITLFDPKDTGDLIGKLNNDFTETYEAYLRKPSIRKKKVKARLLWEKLFKERSETGNIYLLHEENINNASLLNRYIGSSNLCLAGDTVVQTKKGDKELKDVKIGDFVKSYNHSTNKTEYKEVTNAALMNKSAKVMKITDESGKQIICTPDHQVWTENRGYVMAKDLVETDELRISEEMVETRIFLTKSNYDKIKKSGLTFTKFINNNIT